MTLADLYALAKGDWRERRDDLLAALEAQYATAQTAGT
jgi:hypothetical protein